MAIVYLSLGSNLGDRLGYLQQATSLLGALPGTNIIATSSFYESEPWQMNSNNWFVNAIVQISTALSPQELLDECKRIENQLGREIGINRGVNGGVGRFDLQTGKNGEKGVNNYSDRTIDIDILFYENQILNTDTLTIPHRFFHRRAFVIVPMLEIAEDFVHPLFNKTIETLYEELENPEMVTLYGTRL